jgi:hypothetical protein
LVPRINKYTGIHGKSQVGVARGEYARGTPFFKNIDQNLKIVLQCSHEKYLFYGDYMKKIILQSMLIALISSISSADEIKQPTQPTPPKQPVSPIVAGSSTNNQRQTNNTIESNIINLRTINL